MLCERVLSLTLIWLFYFCLHKARILFSFHKSFIFIFVVLDKHCHAIWREYGNGCYWRVRSTCTDRTIKKIRRKRESGKLGSFRYFIKTVLLLLFLYYTGFSHVLYIFFMYISYKRLCVYFFVKSVATQN